MDKIRYGKSVSWVAPVGVLLRLFALITAQPGFLSISCGGKTNHTAENNITWVIDAPYIDVGQAADTGFSSVYGSYLHTMRYFPKPLNKSCYHLPVTPHVPHLLRLWFTPGNSSGYKTWQISFALSIETVDLLFAENTTIPQNTRISDYYVPFLFEYILVTTGRVLYICLVRTLEDDDPSISAIEMRRLQYGMYQDAQPGTILVTLSRWDVGGNSTVRYPHDKFDRMWIPADGSISGAAYSTKSSTEPISTNNTKNLPPTAVLQTAWVTIHGTLPILPQYWSQYIGLSLAPTVPTLLLLYFAEIENLNMSESRSFLVEIDGKPMSETITLVRNYSIQEVSIQPPEPKAVFSLIEGSDSTLPPIINAFEYYWVGQSAMPTYAQDIDALNAIKSRGGIKEWISADPCYLIPWDSIGCDKSSGI